MWISVRNAPSSIDKRLLDVSGRLGRCLHEDKTVLPGKCFSLLSLHVTARLEITEKF